MREPEHFTVYVIDPDPAIRDSVGLLLESGTVDVLGLKTRTPICRKTL